MGACHRRLRCGDRPLLTPPLQGGRHCVTVRCQPPPMSLPALALSRLDKLWQETCWRVRPRTRPLTHQWSVPRLLAYRETRGTCSEVSNNPAQLVTRAMIAPLHTEEPQADLPPESERQPNDGHIVSKGAAERRPALAGFNSTCGEKARKVNSSKRDWHTHSEMTRPLASHESKARPTHQDQPRIHRLSVRRPSARLAPSAARSSPEAKTELRCNRTRSPRPRRPS